MKKPHISLQIFVLRVWFHADEVAEHAGHDVVTKDDDLLREKFEAAGVARYVHFGNFGL
jgi:hypothetical protein